MKNKLTEKNLKDATYAVVTDRKEYYRTWLFDYPIVTTKCQHEENCALQKIMYKMVCEFAGNYFDKWQQLMPVSEEVSTLLSKWQDKAYRVGTYRTDFICDFNHQPKIIEITCRFALNAFFHAATYDNFSSEFLLKNYPYLSKINPYSGFFSHFISYFNESNRAYVIAGSDLRNESKLFSEIFEKAGIQLTIVNYQEISKIIENITNELIISELSHSEWLSLPNETIEKLSERNVINDPRTIFLIHDKRFFSVLGSKELRNSILDDAEINLLNNFYIPTYQYSEAQSEWQHARDNKDGWILKHRNMGKSQDVYAGPLTEHNTWLALFERSDIEDFVLQKYVSQARLQGTVGSIKHLDYFAGTYLYFDNNYFGYGEYRTSSYPVSNKYDHGKAYGLIIPDTTKTIIDKRTDMVT